MSKRMMIAVCVGAGHWSRLAAVVMLSLASGCVASATVTMKDGEVIDGVIERGTPREMNVRTEDGMRQIERAEITEIDHPSAAMVTGLAMTGVGGAAALIGERGVWNTCGVFGTDEEPGCDLSVGAVIVGGTLFAAGLATTIVGALQYTGSSERVDHVTLGPSVMWSPVVAPDGRGGGLVGVSVSW